MSVGSMQVTQFVSGDMNGSEMLAVGARLGGKGFIHILAEEDDCFTLGTMNIALSDEMMDAIRCIMHDSDEDEGYLSTWVEINWEENTATNLSTGLVVHVIGIGELGVLHDE